MTLINVTPHEIVIFDSEGKNVIKRIAPSGVVARLTTNMVACAPIDGIPVFSTQFGKTECLPVEQEGTHFIVSALILKAHPERMDLVVPNESVRDGEGRIIGCKSLSR